MNVVFVYNKFPSSLLTLIATGSACYHVAFADGEYLWDMNLIRRRRLWPEYMAKHTVFTAPCPVEVTREYLDRMLDTDESTYGVWDYLLFALRPIYHLFGKSTRNRKGIICSEMVYEDLKANGWQVRFAEVPSPADLERAIIKKER